MKRKIITSPSEQLRSQFKEFSKYLDSIPKLSERKSYSSAHKDENLLKTTRLPQSTRSITKNFRMRPFIQISVPDSDFMTKVSAFDAGATNDLNSVSSRQRAVSKSLFEGSSAVNIDKSKMQLPIVETIVSEKNSEQGIPDIEKYVNSLYSLSDLKHDIEMTYQIARSYHNPARETAQVGLFFSIQQELSKAVESSIGANEEIIELEVAGIVDKYIAYMREVIRTLRSKGDTETPIILEMILRCLIKVIDSVLKRHSSFVNTVNQEHQKTFEMFSINKNLEFTKKIEIYNEKEKNYLEEIKKLTNIVKDLRNEINDLKDSLSDKEQKILKLTEIDGGFEAMKSMSGLLENLNSVIMEARNNKRKKKTAMAEISEFINTANTLVAAPKVRVALTQTSWSIKKDLLSLPKYTEPKLSFHNFINLDSYKLIENQLEIPTEEIKSLFIKSLHSYNPDFPFILHFSKEVLTKYKTIEPAAHALYTICIKLKQMSTTWSDLMSNMLSLNYKFPSVLEPLISKLIKIFENCKPSLTSSDLTLDEYLTLIQKSFKACQELKDHLNCHIIMRNSDKSDDSNVETSIFQSFLLRLVASFEKSNKNFNKEFENYRKNKNEECNTYIVLVDEFEKFLSKKNKFKYSTQEMSVVWDHFEPNLYGFVNYHKIVSEIQYDKLVQTVKNSKVTLQDYLSISVNFIVKEYFGLLDRQKDWAEFSTLEQLLEALKNENINTSPDAAGLILTQIMLKKNFSAINGMFKLIPAALAGIGPDLIKKKVKKNK